MWFGGVAAGTDRTGLVVVHMRPAERMRMPGFRPLRLVLRRGSALAVGLTDGPPGIRGPGRSLEEGGDGRVGPGRLARRFGRRRRGGRVVEQRIVVVQALGPC